MIRIASRIAASLKSHPLVFVATVFAVGSLGTVLTAHAEDIARLALDQPAPADPEQLEAAYAAGYDAGKRDATVASEPAEPPATDPDGGE